VILRKVDEINSLSLYQREEKASDIELSGPFVGDVLFIEEQPLEVWSQINT